MAGLGFRGWIARHTLAAIALVVVVAALGAGTYFVVSKRASTAGYEPPYRQCVVAPAAAVRRLEDRSKAGTRLAGAVAYRDASGVIDRIFVAGHVQGLQPAGISDGSVAVWAYPGFHFNGDPRPANEVAEQIDHHSAVTGVSSSVEAVVTCLSSGGATR